MTPIEQLFNGITLIGTPEQTVNGALNMVGLGLTVMVKVTFSPSQPL